MLNSSVTRGRAIGIPSYTYTNPVRTVLEKHFPTFSPRTASSLQLLNEVQDGTLLASFVSPIDYARKYSSLQIQPCIAISSLEGTQNIRLHFKKGLHRVETLAANPVYPSEIVLAHLLLAEQYNLSPKIIPTNEPLSSLQSNADAALVVDDLEEGFEEREDSLDLTELWQDVFNYPYVHQLFVSSSGNVFQNELTELEHFGALVQKKVDDDFLELENSRQEFVPEMTFAKKKYMERFSFQLGETELEGVKEYFRLAYYYGLLPDIPEINTQPQTVPQFSAN